MLEQFLPHLAALLGLDPATLVLLLGVIVSISNLIGRLIPDTATGWLGTIRKAAKIIGIYVPNNTGILPYGEDKFGVENPPIVPAFPGLDSSRAE